MSTVHLEPRDDVAVLRLDKGRGNAIDEALVLDLARAVRAVADDDSVRGVLLASANAKLFCPGLDLVGLLEYDRPALESFMGKFAAAVWALFALPKPVVAALGGHAVAGGCVLALTADYRVLRRGAQIGLNEVRVGVPLPWSVALLLQASVPRGSLARVALLGNNFKDEAAVDIGLVDELADAEGFEELCLQRLADFTERDPAAFGKTKTYLRAGVLADMRQRERDLAPDFLDCWFSAPTQERIRSVVQSLGKG